ncbi:hypothetical protein [Streptomyces sp. NPDC005209]|uniref:hypothetical protein n=1 Tax=Streptomyces sp. NPDC005209 TaxID=3156715 RepID=UPI0033BEBFDC
MAGSHCLVIRRGPVSLFIGPAFQAADAVALDRPACSTDLKVRALTEYGGGRAVDMLDPSGIPVRVVRGGTLLSSPPPKATCSSTASRSPHRPILTGFDTASDPDTSPHAGRRLRAGFSSCLIRPPRDGGRGPLRSRG